MTDKKLDNETLTAKLKAEVEAQGFKVTPNLMASFTQICTEHMDEILKGYTGFSVSMTNKNMGPSQELMFDVTITDPFIIDINRNRMIEVLEYELKDISLQEASNMVAEAKYIVYQAESKVILLQGEIPCGEPGMQGYSSVRECFDELVDLNKRYDAAMSKIAKLSNSDTDTSDKFHSLFKALSKSKDKTPSNPEVQISSTDNNITALALESGFELKDLGNGVMGLRPYVYAFADKVIANTWKPRTLEFKFENGRIIHPKGAPFDGSNVLLCYQSSWVTGNWVEASGSGENTEGFCWYIDLLDEEVEFDAPTAWLPNPNVVSHHFDEEEPSPAVKAAWNRFQQALDKKFED